MGDWRLWALERPQEEGTYLLVGAWGGCGCIRRSCLAWFREFDPADREEMQYDFAFEYQTSEGSYLGVEAEPRSGELYRHDDGTFDIDLWMPANVPQNWDEPFWPKSIELESKTN